MGNIGGFYPFGLTKRKRRAAVLAFSLILVVIAGFATLRWLSYVTESQRMAGRDRARMQAFYAAEAGVEQVIDYLNNSDRYDFRYDPIEYDDVYSSPSFTPAVSKDYPMFEPFAVRASTDDEGNIIVDKATFFRDTSDGFSSKIPTCVLFDASDSTYDELAEDLTFTDLDDQELAHVQSLILMHPADFSSYGETEVDADDFVITKVISTATTPQGVSVTVECLLAQNPLAAITTPGAIVSEGTLEYNGSFNVHWGEVWSKSDVSLPQNWNDNNPSNDNGNSKEVGIPNESDDEWFMFRTEGVFRDHKGEDFADGSKEKGYSDTAITNVPGNNYYQPFLEDLLFGDPLTSEFADYENLYQNQADLEFPTYDYDKIKEHFLSYGLPYYYTGPNGEIYGIDRDPESDTYNEIINQSFDEWFDFDDPANNLAEYWDADQFYVFIDSIPVNDAGEYDSATKGKRYDSTYYPRGPDTTSDPIKQSGKSTHTRGFFFIARDIEFGGAGSPVDADEITDKDGDPYVISPPREQGGHESIDDNTDLSHNGLMYCWGSMKYSGNPSIYGSLYAKDGYEGSGTPEVWYNYRLQDGLWFENKSDVVRTAWNVRKTDLPNI